MSRLRPTVAELLGDLERSHIRPFGIMAVYQGLCRDHPDWQDSAIREAAIPIVRRMDEERWKVEVIKGERI